MSNTASKINAASLKVLYTLQLLFEHNLSMDDLLHYYELYHNEYLSNFVMSKYINTCRYCGIDIKKIDGKYTILNFPIGINFSASELSLFRELKNCCEKIKLEHFADNMQNILQKINRRIDNPIAPISISKLNDNKIKTFEKACIVSQKIKILFNDEKTLQCEPIDILVDETKTKFSSFGGHEAKEFSPDEIKSVKMLPQKSQTKFMPTTVLFELKGKLAKKYQIRDHEQVLKINSNGNFVITNRLEDKTKLLHRLMRYGENCKIISPKSYVKEMKELIDNTLSNYQ